MTGGDDKAITEKIIGCAFEVHKRLGFGFMESVYERCMVIELRKKGLVVACQVPINVTYDEQEVGHFVADMLVENSVLVELKSVSTLHKAHEIQLVNYLMATGKDVGLLINFGETRVEIKRKVRKLPSRVDF